ncbi:unnamed protein product [Meganyctiphanes norvegica]|uniref:Uncharacterized protein n=1 Tax=Meganyctiphanes norvegica TaxID=48144 RepID=A0AAV2RRB0_MEGNR
MSKTCLLEETTEAPTQCSFNGNVIYKCSNDEQCQYVGMFEDSDPDVSGCPHGLPLPDLTEEMLGSYSCDKPSGKEKIKLERCSDASESKAPKGFPKWAIGCIILTVVIGLGIVVKLGVARFRHRRNTIADRRHHASMKRAGYLQSVNSLA